MVDKAVTLMLASKAKSYRGELHGIAMGGKAADEPNWHVARRCDNGQCVQIGIRGESVLIRSSADPDGRYVILSRDEWRVFVAGVKDGDFDSL
jgi:Domain of unknown function (DUF397)